MTFIDSMIDNLVKKLRPLPPNQVVSKWNEIKDLFKVINYDFTNYKPKNPDQFKKNWMFLKGVMMQLHRSNSNKNIISHFVKLLLLTSPQAEKNLLYYLNQEDIDKYHIIY